MHEDLIRGQIDARFDDSGEIADFTGISAPYEAPAKPELTVDTASDPVDDCVQQIVDYVERNFSRSLRAGKG